MKLNLQIQNKTWFLYLLPFFFVLHGLNENFGLIDLDNAGLLFAIYLGFSLTLASCLFLFLRNWKLSALIVFFCMAFFFFYGAIHDWVKTHAPIPFFGKYIFVFPFTILVWVILFVVFSRPTVRLQRFTFFVNLLLLIYILFDGISIIVKSLSPGTDKLSVYDFARNSHFKPCIDCEKPDIYFIILDEYASSGSLHELYNYHNSFDSFLTKKGFHVLNKSRSNYNLTPFSVSSMLNMDYLTGIKDNNAIGVEDYINCNRLIKENKVIQFVSAQGYQIVNNSVFNLAGYPPVIDQKFLPVKTKLISAGTLFERLHRDFEWWFKDKPVVSFFFPKYKFFNELENNRKLVDLTVLESQKKSNNPRFVYTHLFFPHFPYFLDKNGIRKDPATVFKEFKMNSPTAYLDYLTGGNPAIEKMLDSIQINTNGKAIIMVLGDHGFRNERIEDKKYFFQNMNAIYFPDGDYRLFPDSISLVNQFSLLFNKQFRQSFSIKKDSSIFLKEMK